MAQIQELESTEQLQNTQNSGVILIERGRDVEASSAPCLAILSSPRNSTILIVKKLSSNLLSTLAFC